MKRRRVLETIADAEATYGSLVTDRRVSRRDVMRCVRAGLVKSVGMARLVDGDCIPVEPERWREGFTLTPAGRALV